MHHADFDRIQTGYTQVPEASMSLRSDAYVEAAWFDVDQRAVISRTWQWWCHVEQLREPGQYLAGEVAGMPVVVVRKPSGDLDAFYNVCQHRAHQLLSGAGSVRNIVCPYHAWTYDLSGQLTSARHTRDLVDFDPRSVCLQSIQVEEFMSFVFVNLDPDAPSLSSQTGLLAAELAEFAPDLAQLTFARRLTYDIAANWKNVIDNFLECYHCHVAHKDFVSLVDMSTYKVKTHGIYSSHMALTT
jgi:carnitine monooxygenase subunit